MREPVRLADTPSPPWTVRGADLPRDLPLLERLLLLRGLPPGPGRDAFLTPKPHERLPELLGDPLALPDAPAAVERVARALRRGECVHVFGDYDADGVTATAILVRGLRELGGRVEYYLPHRVRDGFGLNEAGVRAAVERGCRLLITVDNGTSDVREVALARSLGLDVVVTDHHAIGDALPPALAVVNPHRAEGAYPYRSLCGAGLAYALLRGVMYASGGRPRSGAGAYAQLAALGTVADVAPLDGENRLLVRAGLVAMNTRPLPGVRALLDAAGVAAGAASEADISYKLAPRLNAAGRMADAGLACELLLEDDPARARRLAARLEALNDERRVATDQMLALAATLADGPVEGGGDVLTVYGEDWSPALLGIVAGRLSRRHGVPVVAATSDGAGVRASARSLPGLDITRALEGCAHLLSEYGGHAQAAGFSTTPDGLKAVHEHLVAAFRGTRRERPVEVDAELDPGAIPRPLGDDLDALAPFGQTNPEPLFGLRAVRPLDIRLFGKQRTHLSLRLPAPGGTGSEVVGFGMADAFQSLAAAPSVDLVVRALRQRDGTYRPLRFGLEHAFPHP